MNWQKLSKADLLTLMTLIGILSVFNLVLYYKS